MSVPSKEMTHQSLGKKTATPSPSSLPAACLAGSKWHDARQAERPGCVQLGGCPLSPSLSAPIANNLDPGRVWGGTHRDTVRERASSRQFPWGKLLERRQRAVSPWVSSLKSKQFPSSSRESRAAIVIGRDRGGKKLNRHLGCENDPCALIAEKRTLRGRR